MNRDEIIGWLKETNEERLQGLWDRADAVRRESVGDAVHLRGLIEVSNICARDCFYCGIRCSRHDLPRYRLSTEEIVDCARQAIDLGYGTVVLQSGEDYGFTRDGVCEIIRRIKSLPLPVGIADGSLAVTLSLGERDDDELAAWKDAGADRYLLRFETSNRVLYDRIHPPLAGRRSDRFAILRRLGELGYEVGSGVMVGIPGQSYDDLANDIGWFRRLDLDMIGVGPFVPHPDTPLGQEAQLSGSALEPGDQVPGDELTTYKVVALTRLTCPAANIPSTTALATLNRASGRELGLMRGANIVMPNLTPPKYRQQYEIYPDKACVTETAEFCRGCLRERIAAIGRTVGTGRGDSPNRRGGR
jgi:biotin synthase